MIWLGCGFGGTDRKALAFWKKPVLMAASEAAMAVAKPDAELGFKVATTS